MTCSPRGALCGSKNWAVFTRPSAARVKQKKLMFLPTPSGELAWTTGPAPGFWQRWKWPVLRKLPADFVQSKKPRVVSLQTTCGSTQNLTWFRSKPRVIPTKTTCGFHRNQAWFENEAFVFYYTSYFLHGAKLGPDYSSSNTGLVEGILCAGKWCKSVSLPRFFRSRSWCYRTKLEYYTGTGISHTRANVRNVISSASPGA